MSAMEHNGAENELRELTEHEIRAVSGGNPLMLGLAIYGMADIVYDAFKGFRDGFTNRAN